MPISLNPIQRNPEKAKAIQEYLEQAEDDYGKMLTTAFADMNKKMIEARKAAAKKKKSSKKLGSITLSNTDSVSTCMRVKTQLNNKLWEIYSSDIDNKVKQMLAKDVMLQITKVDMKISEINRREEAVREEKKVKKNESSRAKRKRQKDMEKRTTTIRKDYLYTVPNGGFDPADPLSLSSFAQTAEPAAVTAEIGGNEAAMCDGDVSTAVTETAVSLEVTV